MYSIYKQELNLILIGLDLDDGVESVYRRYSRKYDLNMPVTFDNAVFKQYGIRGVPHVIWINEQGIVQAITNVLHQGHLEKFLAGKQFEFISYDPEGIAKMRAFDPDEPFFVSGNGGEEVHFLQRSLLAQWKSGMPSYMPWAESNRSPLEGLRYLQAIGREVADLYRIAYFGKTYRWHPDDSAYGNYHYSPILEIQDKSKFESDFNIGKNLFCYSQVLPKERRNPDHMMEVMQRDLKNFFGYDVLVETRQMPYLSLVATDKARKKLISRGGSGKSSFSLIELDLIDQPISRLIQFLSYNLSLTENDLPLIDETEIRENIDISFNAIMTDFHDVIRSLQEQGLYIIRKEKPMKVIVVMDPQRVTK